MQNDLTIAIASGKGGTGKTTVATNLAYAIKDQIHLQLIDCDVEEPNSHLFLQPVFQNREQVTIPVPTVDQNQCITCGKCRDLCVYNAITLIGENVLVFPELCHGCGGCSYICPVQAIGEEAREIGEIAEGEVVGIDFLHGRSKIGNPLTPPIIKELKKKIANDRVTILDAPPGTSCPVVATLIDVDYVILVTEPTPFGLHDLHLTVEVVRQLEIPFGVIINRFGLGYNEVERYCQNEDIPILMKIPFRREYASWYAQGKIIVEQDHQLAERFRQVFQEIVRGSQA